MLECCLLQGLRYVHWIAFYLEKGWKIQVLSQHVKTNLFKGCGGCTKSPCLFESKYIVLELSLQGPAFSHAAGLYYINLINYYIVSFLWASAWLFLLCTTWKGFLCESSYAEVAETESQQKNSLLDNRCIPQYSTVEDPYSKKNAINATNSSSLQEMTTVYFWIWGLHFLLLKKKQLPRCLPRKCMKGTG